MPQSLHLCNLCFPSIHVWVPLFTIKTEDKKQILITRPNMTWFMFASTFTLLIRSLCSLDSCSSVIHWLTDYLLHFSLIYSSIYPFIHLIIIPDKVEELRKAAVYLCSRMSQAIRIFSAGCFLPLSKQSSFAGFGSLQVFPMGWKWVCAFEISVSGASVLLAQRWSERKQGDHSGSCACTSSIFLSKIRQGRQLSF